MHDVTALGHPDAKPYTPADNPAFIELHRRFPTIAYLRQRARRRLPRFAFEYLDGGAGADGGIARNWRCLDAVELIPRYGITTALPPVDIELFGKRYAAPIGVAAMGGPSIVWPGADQYLAAAAQRARVPYTLGLAGGMTVEHAVEIAPDVLWFQLYRCSRNEHAIGYDLVRRADAAGVHVLVLTLDVPVRTTRARARSPPGLPHHSDRTCAWCVAFSGVPDISHRCGNMVSRALAISSLIPRQLLT
jgi:(S)-mandelate dehydrogenase